MHDELAQQFVRSLRGRRSQASMSKRLWFKTNAVYTWECGRSEPTALQVFELAEKTGKPAAATLAGFYRERPAWLTAKLERGTLAKFLEQERQGIPLVTIAAATGISRFSLARYLGAEADIRLPDLLRVIDFCTHRLLDFLALWVDPGTLPCVAEAWRELHLARRAAYERPWSHAVLRCLELEAYRNSSAHDPRFIAEQLGITLDEVQACLELLQQSQQIAWTGSHYRGQEESAVALSADPAAARAQAAWWLSVATQRAASQRGMFAYNLCCVSAADLQRIAELQRDYLRQVRAIVAASTPGQRVALIGVQVMGFDGAITPELSR